MAEGVHGTEGDSSSSDGGYDSDNVRSRDKIRRSAKQRKERFEAERGAVGLTEDQVSADSIAADALLGTPAVSSEPWALPDNDDPEDEKQFFVQEELYVHAKVCIIDDRTVICGSSNINDRSQLGDHDSELAVVVQDPTPLESTMAGAPYTAAHFAATLRRSLWREHLGLLPPQGLSAADDLNARPPGAAPNDYQNGERTNPAASSVAVEPDELRATWDRVADPLDPKLWDQWCRQASTNTDVFRELFHADPDDTVHTFADYDAFLPRATGGAHAREGTGALSSWWRGEEEKLKEKEGKGEDEGEGEGDSQKLKVDGKEGSERRSRSRSLGSGRKPSSEKKPYKQGHLYCDASVEEVKKKLSEIKGHLVWMPLEFLKDETMAETGLQVNSYTESIFT
jgi:hypothetical protein